MLRRWIRTALDELADDLPEVLPQALRKKQEYAEVAVAIREVHYPSDPDLAAKARERFAYEELLGLQLDVLRMRAARHAEETAQNYVEKGRAA